MKFVVKNQKWIIQVGYNTINHVRIGSSKSGESSSSSSSEPAPRDPEAVGQVQDQAEAQQNGKQSDGLDGKK